MLRIQINASRCPRERPGRSENGFQEKLSLSARMPAVFCARCRYEAFFTQPGPSTASRTAEFEGKNSIVCADKCWLV